MADGIFVAASGAIGQLRSLEIVANNLANSVTPGYKKDEIAFREVLQQADRPEDVADKRYPQLAESVVRREQGALVRTDNPLDIALTGNAYLRVRGRDGEGLTRNGRLTVGGDGVLRTIGGHTVLDRSGQAARIPPSAAVQIHPNGAVVDERGETVASLGIQGVADDAPLRKSGDGLFDASQPAPLREESQVLQGFIESSNANPVKTMIDLVETQRNFSALHQVIQTYRDVDRRAIELSRQA